MSPPWRQAAIDPEHPDADLLAEAGDVLRAGGLVAFPTETVYGLGGNALDDAAVRRIFAAKERASDDPLIVHLSDAAELPRVAREIPPLALVLARLHFPGSVTSAMRVMLASCIRRRMVTTLP